MAVSVPFFTLKNGVLPGQQVKIPSVGLGCWMGEPGGGERVEEMVKTSLKVCPFCVLYEHYLSLFVADATLDVDWV